MKINILLFTALLLFSAASARQSDSNIIKTESTDLIIHPILHGTLVLDWNGMSIYVDPYGGKKVFQGMKRPDLILITDIHGDHLNKETLGELDLSKATILAPSAVVDQLGGDMKKNAKVISNGEDIEWEGMNISAIPMYNLPESEDSRHTKGRGNGYILTIGGKRIYISGDTEDIPEMRQLDNIDVAFVCMNQPYTMDVTQAADAVLEFKPKIVYPYHYRGSAGLSDVEEFKRLVISGDKDIEVRLRNWYPEK